MAGSSGAPTMSMIQCLPQHLTAVARARSAQPQPFELTAIYGRAQPMPPRTVRLAFGAENAD